MPAQTVSREWLNFKDEDYTDAVCLLLPKGQATLIDAEHFEWASQFDWKVMGRSIFYVVKTPVSYLEMPWRWGRRQRRRIPASSRMHSLSRAVMLHGLGMCDGHNLRNRLHRNHIDHISRNPWDNRRKNLRVATPSQNQQNRPGVSGKSSRYKGVSRSTAKTKVTWTATAMVRGKRYHLGTFGDEVEAAMAYNRFVAAKCGEFAYLNPITISSDGSDAGGQSSD